MLLFPVVILSVAGETDREFMKALFIRHRITMLRVARTLTKSDPDAEDVVSEACVLLIGKISRLRQLDCNVLEGYVISTVKNAAYLLHRRKRGARRRQARRRSNSLRTRTPRRTGACYRNAPFRS